MDIDAKKKKKPLTNISKLNPEIYKTLVQDLKSISEFIILAD